MFTTGEGMIGETAVARRGEWNRHVPFLKDGALHACRRKKMISMKAFNRNGWVLRTIVTAAAIVAYPAVVSAQEQRAPQKQPGDASGPEHSQPSAVDRDRGYESDRREALEAHERFEYDDIPPGYTVQTWHQELAASDAYDRGYEQGYRRGWEAAQRALGAQRNLTLRTSLLEDGDRYFREGRYGDAARSFLLAARQGQGDPVARLRAAHAMTALGHYERAWLLVRRAFQLESRLPYLQIDIRQDYDNVAEFERHRELLAKAATDAGDAPELWALLGYYRFFSEDGVDAVPALNRAAELAPESPVIRELREVARVSVPASVSDRMPRENEE